MSTRHRCNCAVAQAGAAAGLDKRVHCHTFRMASAYYYTFQRMAYFQGNSAWSGDVLGSWRPCVDGLDCGLHVAADPGPGVR